MFHLNLDFKTISIIHSFTVTQRRQNENIFIPKGAIHRMANRKDRDLVIIEMWYGDNLDENDIKRYEDIYERI